MGCLAAVCACVCVGHNALVDSKFDKSRQQQQCQLETKKYLSPLINSINRPRQSSWHWKSVNFLTAKHFIWTVVCFYVYHSTRQPISNFKVYLTSTCFCARNLSHLQPFLFCVFEKVWNQVAMSLKSKVQGTARSCVLFYATWSCCWQQTKGLIRCNVQSSFLSSLPPCGESGASWNWDI